MKIKVPVNLEHARDNVGWWLRDSHNRIIPAEEFTREFNKAIADAERWRELLKACEEGRATVVPAILGDGNGVAG